MVDVRLLYPSEKTEASSLLAEAIAAAGYSVEREALSASQPFPPLAAEAGKAGVLLLIWSRGLVTAAMAAGSLAEARRHPNLIEVSVDGIEPAFGSEASPVVLLSGWRGQPFHLGWQRILADIKRLCGSRAGSATSRQDLPSGSGRGAAGAARASASRRPVLRAAIAAGGLFAVALGVAAALERSPPDPVSPAGSRPVAPASAPARAAAASPLPAAAAPQASPDPIFPTAANTPAAEAPAAARTPPRKAAAAPGSDRRRLAATSLPGVKRYSRKHSKTMRLFCQRSGRSTPQCRIFARSMQDRRG